MKLNNQQKVLLCQKALYAKQLVAYANLCKVYKKIAAEIQRDGMTDASSESLSDQVQKYYGPFLAKASQGDLDFLEDTEQQIFNDVEKEAFRAFAEHSRRLDYYRDASAILYDATHEKDDDGTTAFFIDEEKMEEFYSFLNPPKEACSQEENKFFDVTGRSFSKMISENPKRWIGHTYYRLAQKALRVIDEVDSNHIASLNTKNISLSPKSFGATITGARGNVIPIRGYSSPKQEFTEKIQGSYTPSEQKKYGKPVSTLENLEAAAYRVGHATHEKAKSFYKAHKGTIDKAVKKGIQIALVLGMTLILAKGINAAIDAYEFNNTSAYTNESAGYHQTISDETLSTLKETEDLISELSNSNEIPSIEELNETRTALDNEINLVINDLVRNSFESQYPNLTIPEDGIATHYDKTHIDESDIESGHTGNYIYITCYDASGKEYKYTITNFTSVGENRTDDSFSNEYRLDHVIPKDITGSSSGTYNSRSKSVGEIIEEFERIHQETLDLAGTEGFINIPQAEYDNAVIDNNDSLLLSLKAKYSKHSIFAFKPTFKLVIPEKTQTTPTTSNVDRGDR